MQLYLIRHPAPQVAPGVCYGRSDLALAEDVALAAIRIRPHLPPELPLFTSPLTRCRQLAEQLHPAPRHDPRLQEMHFGAWEMLPWKQIARITLDEWAAKPLDFVPPGGESVGQLQERVLGFVAELGATHLPGAALVTHAGVMKVIVGKARALPAREWMALKFEYESVIRVDFQRGA